MEDCLPATVRDLDKEKWTTPSAHPRDTWCSQGLLGLWFTSQLCAWTGI